MLCASMSTMDYYYQRYGIAVFDSGLSSFADDGTILVSNALSSAAVEALGLQTTRRLQGLTDSHRLNMARHRARRGFSSKH
jgi:hypothetical protein